MSYSLHSVKGVMQGIIHGSIIGLTKGDARSFDQAHILVLLSGRLLSVPDYGLF